MPFFHSAQMETWRTPLGAMGGTQGQLSSLQAFGAVNLQQTLAGVWQIRNQEATGLEWITLDDQDFFIPEFRVAAVSVSPSGYSSVQSSFLHLNYDMGCRGAIMAAGGCQLYNASDGDALPASHGNANWFPTAVMNPVWITRIRFTAETTATAITLWR